MSSQFLRTMLTMDDLLDSASFVEDDFFKTTGANRGSNPGPLAPKARIIPLDYSPLEYKTPRKFKV